MMNKLHNKQFKVNYKEETGNLFVHLSRTKSSVISHPLQLHSIQTLMNTSLSSHHNISLIKSRFSVSRTMRKSPSITTTKIPDDIIRCSTSRGIFLPPLAASTRISASDPPSRAGNGRRLITARLRLITAANWNSPSELDLATSAPTAIMATGPETLLAD